MSMTKLSVLLKEVKDLRIAKCMTLIIGLALVAAGCGGGERRIPSAAESMEKNKFVRIATDAVNAPFEFGSGTGVQGFDVDIGNEIAKDLGIEVKWVKITGYDRLFETLKNGEAEIVISAIAIDPGKGDAFAFSDPYYDTGDIIYTRAEDFGIKDLASLSGKRVGVGTGRTADAFMAGQTTATGVTITKKPSLDDALGALNRGELDAVVGDETILKYSGFKSFISTRPVPDVWVNRYQYGAVVRKGETDLLNKINQTIARMKSSGELDKLREKWFEQVIKDAQKQREEDLKLEELKKAPKTINVTINKIGGTWNMDRLDGFVLRLEGPAGRYESDYVLTSGNQGRCKFKSPVPPGDYKINMSPFLKVVQDVPVPSLPKSTLAMEMNISTTGIVITFK